METKRTKAEIARLNGKKGGRPRKNRDSDVSVSEFPNPPATEITHRNRSKGGRPKGRKNAATLEREAVLREYRQRVCRLADDLLDAELTVARGVTFLFRKPKSGKDRKVERVTDEETIKRYLDGELDSDEQDWYFIAAEKPDTATIRGMFDRTFDRPAQRHELTGGGGGPVQVVASSADERL